ncbi:phosphoribosylanthranilate isomerase [Acuticoccus kandeliae]|uniref:phosphoribosylanthranilate isomerase n=1 Tax=Acuticoccus kandeliae TaxID=2073160 RepID=UPI000D3EAEB0|nr:N-(5'-phosphoribosyl)anthranilate isomerase [Acuticoccus kandeliae]
MQRTRVKICCIRSHEEVALAVAAGADAVGFVGPMPTGPGPVPDELTRDVAARVPAPVAPWLLTSETHAEAIVAHAEFCAVTTVQIVQHVAPEVHADLARIAPWLRRVQVIHVEGRDALDLIAAYGDGPHTYLLDSGRPSVDELGGTGRVHDWSVSADIVKAAAVPVFLAGGLDPANAADAIRTVRPFGLDICSGLRPNTALDPDLLAAFVTAMRRADDEIYHRAA